MSWGGHLQDELYNGPMNIFNLFVKTCVTKLRETDLYDIGCIVISSSSCCGDFLFVSQLRLQKFLIQLVLSGVVCEYCLVYSSAP